MDVDWGLWETLIRERGIVVNRPRGSRHPRYAETVYPLNYGYIPGTIGGDGAEIDVFVGSAGSGLCGAVLTDDALKGDREIKLLWNVTPDEAESILRFLNAGQMAATLLRRSEQ